jgi:hypothetical protein
MPPKNTYTQGYFSEDPTDKPHKDVSEPSSSSSESPPEEEEEKKKKITTSDNLEDDLVTVSHGSPPSPTASDILLKFDIEDTLEATNLNEQWKDLGDSERKKKLKRLLETFTAVKEERERKEVEEMKRKSEEDGEDDEGKGKGKKA